MLYDFLKFPAKIASWFYTRRLTINNRQLLELKGPLLIAANHPNSFLDAIIVDTFFKNTVHALTRGDVFKKPFHRKLLNQLNMLPVYRLREGAENLDINYQTFELCKNIFRKDGLVLIFSEGGCINEWKLRPLKKGTARLAISSWQQAIPLRVLPLGINYSSFRRFGKNIELNFGTMITENDLKQVGDGKRILEFNALLKEALDELVVQIPKQEKSVLKEKFYVHVSAWRKIVLFFPALIGFITHAPLYYPIKIYTKKSCKNNDHYDSILVAILFLSYPLYLLLLMLLAYLISGSLFSFLLVMLIPLFGKAFVEVKGQLDH